LTGTTWAVGEALLDGRCGHFVTEPFDQGGDGRGCTAVIDATPQSAYQLKKWLVYQSTEKHDKPFFKHFQKTSSTGWRPAQRLKCV
jgi:hypothetical protein